MRVTYPKLSDALTRPINSCLRRVAPGFGKVNKLRACLITFPLAGVRDYAILLPTSSPGACVKQTRLMKKYEFASARSSAILATLTEGISKLSGP